MIKRVIGLPGETVYAQNGTVHVDGRILSEDYVNPACDGTTDFPAIRVPPGDVFLLGDNRCDSSDSRVFGPVPTSSLVGHAVLRVWPVWRLKWL